jgi:anti-sigma factor RsiW
MTPSEIPVTADELHAFVDGELPPDRLDAVQAWLTTHPDDAAEVASWRTISEAIHARYDSVADEPMPKRLEIEQLTRRPLLWRMAAAAAVLLAFAGGGTIGWFMHDSETATSQPNFGTLTGDAIEAHRLYVVEMRHPVEVDGSERTHLVQWLSKRLGYDVMAPQLDNAGLKLVGGRLLPGPGAPAAFLMYEGASGERFTFYCAKSKAANSQMRYQTQDPDTAVTWSDNGVGFVVTGPDNRDRIRQVADLVYDQVERSSTSAK